MSTAVVDARGWQNTFDLETGERTEAAGPVVEMVRGVLGRHPYPGDTDAGSNRWVTDTALDLIGSYAPRFVFLIYAAQLFSIRHMKMSPEERARTISDAFLEVRRFMDESGLPAIVVGTGGMTPLLGDIDLTRLDGLGVCTHWSTRYAGLYSPSPDDMRFLEEHPHIDRVVPRDEVAALFAGSPEQAATVPEFLLVAGDGYAFKSVSDAKRAPVMVNSRNIDVPVHAPCEFVGDITGIRQTIESALSAPPLTSERGCALIFLEGAGVEDFPWPHQSCANNIGWYYYEPGEAQYLTISSGRHRFLDYPAGSGSKYFDDTEDRVGNYPFSGHFKAVPRDTIGEAFSGRSIAVGNKSMFMHMVAGADIAIECFARNLYNQGTMAVIHREKP
jgi:hypothetical protein